MPLAPASRRLCRLSVILTALGVGFCGVGCCGVSLSGSLTVAIAAGPSGADASLAHGVAYLVAPANLIDGHYYQSLPHTADFGLTIDGGLALAATGKDPLALKKIVGFIDAEGTDGSGKTVNYWTGVGTKFASGGSLAKEALLAEVVGANPRRFGGHDLIAALDATVCRQASPSAAGPCPAAGGYSYSNSVFDQALGIIAQLRAGQPASAAKPVAYLESLRNSDGSFPSLIPATRDQDVDSTALAVMALALVRGAVARTDVSSGLAWIAAQQAGSGGFHGVGAISINSTGLAIQALALDRARYGARIRAALTFLRTEQNPDGGFNADAGGQRGSDLRASAQAVSGATGLSFGTLTRALGRGRGPGLAQGASRSGGGALGWLRLVLILAVVAAALAGVGLLLRRRSAGPPGGPAAAPQDRVRS